MTTKAAVLKLARKEWPECYIAENPKAAMSEEKVLARAKREELKAEKATLEQEQQALGRTDLKLREAARFAVDVDGDEPSWTQLKAALEADERRQTIGVRLLDIRREMSALEGLSFVHRWEICKRDGICIKTMHHADTLEELAAKIARP